MLRGATVAGLGGWTPEGAGTSKQQQKNKLKESRRLVRSEALIDYLILSNIYSMAN